MYLILMRHGIAEDGMPDEARELTQKGAERVALMAVALDRLGFRPDVVLTSPRVRAAQTAEIVRSSMALKAPLVVTSALDFTAPWDDFEAEVNGCLKEDPTRQILLATGHQPQLGMLMTMAAHGEETGFDLRKGGCTGIRFPGARIAAGTGEVRFYLTPSLAKRLL